MKEARKRMRESKHQIAFPVDRIFFILHRRVAFRCDLESSI